MYIAWPSLYNSNSNESSASVNSIHELGFQRAADPHRYLPQAFLNWRNQSTVGCNIHNFLLDFVGGALSLGQLMLDCAVTDNWSAITGDVAKFGLGCVQ